MAKFYHSDEQIKIIQYKQYICILGKHILIKISINTH